MPTAKPIEERFWAMVDQSGDCWIWTGSKSKKGYGQIATKRGSRPLQVHRFSYELHFGAIPKGMFVCHRCDTPACVRPDHLFVGTAKDNTHDMMAKRRGRNQFGPHTVIEYNGMQATISEWAELMKIPSETLYRRLKRGWAIEKTLMTEWFPLQAYYES